MMAKLRTRTQVVLDFAGIVALFVVAVFIKEFLAQAFGAEPPEAATGVAMKGDGVSDWLDVLSDMGVWGALAAYGVFRLGWPFIERQVKWAQDLAVQTIEASRKQLEDWHAKRSESERHHVQALVALKESIETSNKLRNEELEIARERRVRRVAAAAAVKRKGARKS